MSPLLPTQVRQRDAVSSSRSPGATSGWTAAWGTRATAGTQPGAQRVGGGRWFRCGRGSRWAGPEAVAVAGLRGSADPRRLDVPGVRARRGPRPSSAPSAARSARFSAYRSVRSPPRPAEQPPGTREGRCLAAPGSVAPRRAADPHGTRAERSQLRVEGGGAGLGCSRAE